jgi:hypothetical protein
VTYRYRSADSKELQMPTEKPIAKMPEPQPSDNMPGNQAALPKGSLSKPFLGPQGDENRSNAPAAPKPEDTKR